MNKKGFIFTFISVILVSVIMLAFLIQYTSRTQAEIEMTNTEVETINSFVKSLNNDYLPRALRVSGNQAILALLHCMDTNVVCDDRIEEILNDKGGYLGNDRQQLEAYIINAIVDGEFSYDYERPENPPPDLELMEVDGVSYNLPLVLNEIKNLAETTGIDLNFEEIIKNRDIQDITVDQTDPWNIHITINIRYILSNKDEDIQWDYINQPKVIEALVPIFNFRDPIYLIADPDDPDDGVEISINESTYKFPSGVEDHVENTLFLACDQAPDFLQRMQGSTEPSGAYGIESMIDIKDSTQSAIDYQYIFRNDGENPSPENLIQIGQSSYYIDETHVECYPPDEE